MKWGPCVHAVDARARTLSVNMYFVWKHSKLHIAPSHSSCPPTFLTLRSLLSVVVFCVCAEGWGTWCRVWAMECFLVRIWGFRTVNCQETSPCQECSVGFFDMSRFWLWGFGCCKVFEVGILKSSVPGVCFRVQAWVWGIWEFGEGVPAMVRNSGRLAGFFVGKGVTLGALKKSLDRRERGIQTLWSETVLQSRLTGREYFEEWAIKVARKEGCTIGWQKDYTDSTTPL